MIMISHGLLKQMVSKEIDSINKIDILSFLDLGNYRIQYLDNGLTDYKSGAELRKALPLIE